MRTNIAGSVCVSFLITALHVYQKLTLYRYMYYLSGQGLVLGDPKTLGARRLECCGRVSSLDRRAQPRRHEAADAASEGGSASGVVAQMRGDRPHCTQESTRGE